MHFLVIGGSDAGISAALRARELDSSADVTVLLDDDFPNYSICGLPFFLSGETSDWRELAHRKDFADIDVRRGHRAIHIEPNAGRVGFQSGTGQGTLSYDKLLIATGARPSDPKIVGSHLPGVFLLHSMADSFAVHEFLERAKPARAIIIGAGYIGLEMADALTHRGIEVTVVSRPDSILSTVDSEFGAKLEVELCNHGVAVQTSVAVSRIDAHGSTLQVTGDGFDQRCDMILIAVGVTPNTSLGVEAGAQVGLRGAFTTNRSMESSLPDIYVAGDCTETWHRSLNRYTYLPLGTTAHKQGRVAGENAVGGQRTFAGSLGTQVVKVFTKVVGRTGLKHTEALQEGANPLTVAAEHNDHKAYYPGATTIFSRLTGDVDTGKLLGAQLMGTYGAEISKRLDVFACALHQSLSIDELSDLDLSYTPPLSSPWDPVQMASQQWSAVQLASTFRRTNEDSYFRVRA